MSLASIPEIISELSSGRVVLVDDENRENEGDFIFAAEFITPELVNFLTRVGGGTCASPSTARPASASTSSRRGATTPAFARPPSRSA